jgi:hypothetical protein
MLAAPADASGDMIGKRRLQDSASSVPRDPWLPADADPDFARSAPRP